MNMMSFDSTRMKALTCPHVCWHVSSSLELVFKPRGEALEFWRKRATAELHMGWRSNVISSYRWDHYIWFVHLACTVVAMLALDFNYQVASNANSSCWSTMGTQKTPGYSWPKKLRRKLIHDPMPKKIRTIRLAFLPVTRRFFSPNMDEFRGRNLSLLVTVQSFKTTSFETGNLVKQTQVYRVFFGPKKPLKGSPSGWKGLAASSGAEILPPGVEPRSCGTSSMDPPFVPLLWCNNMQKA